MQTIRDSTLEKYISFEYTSFDRVVLRGYLQRLFVEGSVINLLRNLGFNSHSNGVMRILTDKLNSHIKKTAEKLGTELHWWGEPEKKRYHSKIDFIQEQYKSELAKKNKKSKVIAIIRATENTRTFANKEIRTKQGKTFTKMYVVNKFVSHYYIYIDDQKLGLCYLKIASYIPFVSEFYFNGHNYLKKQFDLAGKQYIMKDNSFTKIEDLGTLNNLVKAFQPSIALGSNSRYIETISQGKLRKLRERGAVKKIQSSHYYRLTREGYIWIFYSFFNSRHMLEPLLSGSYKKAGFPASDQPSIIEGAYSDINKAVSLIMSEFKLVS